MLWCLSFPVFAVESIETCAGNDLVQCNITGATRSVIATQDFSNFYRLCFQPNEESCVLVPIHEGGFLVYSTVSPFFYFFLIMSITLMFFMVLL